MNKNLIHFLKKYKSSHFSFWSLFMENIVSFPACAWMLDCFNHVLLFETPWTVSSPPGPSVHGILQDRILELGYYALLFLSDPFLLFLIWISNILRIWYPHFQKRYDRSFNFLSYISYVLYSAPPNTMAREIISYLRKLKWGFFSIFSGYDVCSQYLIFSEEFFIQII